MACTGHVTTNKTVLDVPFQRAWPFRNGVAVFREGDKSGLIDKTGRVLFQTQFASIEMVSDELIRVEDRDKRVGYIDYNGKYVWKPTN